MGAAEFEEINGKWYKRQERLHVKSNPDKDWRSNTKKEVKQFLNKPLKRNLPSKEYTRNPKKEKKRLSRDSGFVPRLFFK